MDGRLIAALLALAAAAPQSDLGSLDSFGSFGSFSSLDSFSSGSGFSSGLGRSSGSWSGWSRGGLEGRTEAEGRRREGSRPRGVFGRFERQWLEGGRNTEDGFWYQGAQLRRLEKVEKEVEEEDVKDNNEGALDTSGGMERLEEDQLWYRGGLRALTVGGQRERSNYRSLAAAKPGKWYEVSTDDQGFSKDYFIRKSNELSRSWDELIAGGTTSYTHEGARARFLGRESEGSVARGEGPRQGGRRDKGGRKGDLRR
jgi:hypothetical protein